MLSLRLLIMTFLNHFHAEGFVQLSYLQKSEIFNKMGQMVILEMSNLKNRPRSKTTAS